MGNSISPPHLWWICCRKLLKTCKCTWCSQFVSLNHWSTTELHCWLASKALFMWSDALMPWTPLYRNLLQHKHYTLHCPIQATNSLKQTLRNTKMKPFLTIVGFSSHGAFSSRIAILVSPLPVNAAHHPRPRNNVLHHLRAKEPALPSQVGLCLLHRFTWQCRTNTDLLKTWTETKQPQIKIALFKHVLFLLMLMVLAIV